MLRGASVTADAFRPADTGIVDSYRPESAPGYGPRSSASPGRPAAARPARLLVRRAGRQQGSRIAAPLPGGAAIRHHEIPGRATPDRTGLAADVSQRYEPSVHALCARGDAGSVRDIDELRPRPRMSLPARGNRFRRLRNRPARLLSATMPARHRPPAPRPQGRPFAGPAPS